MPDVVHQFCSLWRRGGTDLSAYLPDFAAPAPIAFNRLTLGFTINPNVATNLATLLASRAVRVTVPSNDATREHGTTVVSVALGDSGSFVGTAPGATGIFGTFALTSQLAQLGVAALAQQAIAWNNSWGYTSLGLNQSGWDAAFSGTDGQSHLTALRNYAAWGVVVFAVDSADTGNSGLMDGLPVPDHSFESGWIAVANGVPTLVGTAVSAVYLLSSPCNEAARWCIVADGSWTAATGPGSDYAVTTGSSLEAPQMSGALATGAKAEPQGTVLVIKTMAATPPADRSPPLVDPFASFTGPSLRLEDPEGLGTATLLLPGGGSGAAGLALSRSLDEDDLFSLGGEQGARMTSVTLGLTQDLGATGFLALSGEIGVTDPGGATDITHATTARFDAVKLMAGQGDFLASGDRFQIGVGLPIAVASGQTTARLPVLRQGAAMSHEDVTLDLAPTDRQLDFELGYMALFGQGLDMKLSLVHSENYGNRAGARDTSGAIALGFRS